MRTEHNTVRISMAGVCVFCVLCGMLCYKRRAAAG